MSVGVASRTHTHVQWTLLLNCLYIDIENKSLLMHCCLNIVLLRAFLLYCHVPARWGLQQTTLAPGSNETRARDPLVR